MIYVNDKPVLVSYFPAGESKITMPTLDKRNAEIKWIYENDSELFVLTCVTRYLQDDITTREIVLKMPYLPHARMDRTEKWSDVFTLKYFCEIINSLHFKRVEVQDAHSNVALALLNNLYNETPANIICDDIPDDVILCYPDTGALKKYVKLFPYNKYCYGVKNRNWETGKVDGYKIINDELVKDKTVLIIDDICSKGTTFFHCGQALRKAGAKHVYLYVTHLEPTVETGVLMTSDVIDKIFTSMDSICPKELEEKYPDFIERI